MPRDGSGNYTLPAGNPVVDDTIIETSWANPTMADIAVELNNVLTQDGLRQPLLPLKFVNGTYALPGATFANQLGTGLWNAAASSGYSFRGVTHWTSSAGKLTFNVPIEATSPSKVVGSSFSDVFFESDNGTQVVGMGVNASNYPQMGTRSNHDLQIITNDTFKFNITTDGRIYGLYLHNNAGSVSGSTEQYIASGTFTPASLVSGGYTDINFTAFSGQRGQWTRVGNVVTVSCQFTGSVTTISNDVFVGFQIPIPSGSTLGVGNVQGTATVVFSAYTQAAFIQDVSYTTPKGAEVAIRNCGSSGSCTVFLHFSYVIG